MRTGPHSGLPHWPSVCSWQLRLPPRLGQRRATGGHPPTVFRSTMGSASCPAVGWCVATATQQPGVPAQDPSSPRCLAASWTIAAAPVPGSGLWVLGAVSCPAVGWCIATGNSDTSPTPLIETLSNGTWTPITPPGTGTIDAVSCVAIGSCVAVGTGLIETLSAGTWTATTPPSI